MLLQSSASTLCVKFFSTMIGLLIGRFVIMLLLIMHAVVDAKSSQQKSTAPQPPGSVFGFSSAVDRQRLELDTNAANSVRTSSSDIAHADLSPRPDSEQSKAVDSNACSPTLDVRSLEGLGAVMVEHVRRKTGLSHGKSQLAVATVLNLLAEHVPTSEKLVAGILDDVQHQHVCVLFCCFI